MIDSNLAFNLLASSAAMFALGCYLIIKKKPDEQQILQKFEQMHQTASVAYKPENYDIPPRFDSLVIKQDELAHLIKQTSYTAKDLMTYHECGSLEEAKQGVLALLEGEEKGITVAMEQYTKFSEILRSMPVEHLRKTNLPEVLANWRFTYTYHVETFKDLLTQYAVLCDNSAAIPAQFPEPLASHVIASPIPVNDDSIFLGLTFTDLVVVSCFCGSLIFLGGAVYYRFFSAPSKADKEVNDPQTPDDL